MDSVAIWFEDENEHVERVMRRILRNRSDILSLNNCRCIFVRFKRYSIRAKSFKKIHSYFSSNKIGCCIKILGQGGYQHQIGQDHLLGLSQQSMSRCLKDVCVVIERILCVKHINFALSTEDEQKIKRSFCHACGIPGVIGVVDGTRIQMINPVKNEHLYFNRKLKHNM